MLGYKYLCFMYIISFWNTGTLERDRGSGRGEEAPFEMIGGKCQYYLVSVLDHQIYNLPKFREITSVKKFSSTCWPHCELYNALLSDFRFFFLSLLQEVNTKIKMHYKSKKKSRRTNYINHERWNVRSDQRRLGFWVSHCQVQLTGVDIYAAMIMLIPFFVHLISFISDF